MVIIIMDIPFNMNQVLLNHSQFKPISPFKPTAASGPAGDHNGASGNRNSQGHGQGQGVKSDRNPMPIFIQNNFCGGGGGGLLMPEKDSNTREFWKNYASIEVDQYDSLVNKNYSDKRNVLSQNFVKLQATCTSITSKHVYKHEPIQFIDTLSKIMIEIFGFFIEFPYSNLPSEYEHELLVAGADGINYFFDWCRKISVENTLFPELARIIFECIVISASDNFFAYQRTLLINEIILKLERIPLKVTLLNACLTLSKGSFVTIYKDSRKHRGLIPFSATNSIYRAFLLLEIILTGSNPDNPNPNYNNRYKEKEEKWIEEEQYQRVEAFQRCVEKQGIFFNILDQVKKVTEIAKQYVKYSDFN